MKSIFKASAISLPLFLSLAAFAADTSLLKPPPGARVAIVVFEDLECPTCAREYPHVWEVANANKVPVVLRDFPLAIHPWSFEAAIFARLFDESSEKIGNDFRGYIYRNQSLITKANLRQYVDKFASDNKVPVPFAVDADGKLKAKILADRDLGTQLGIQGTPAIYVVGTGGAPAAVTQYDKLDQVVQEMLAKSPPAKSPAKPAAKTKKKAARKAP